jgi:hypothetical protein
MGYVGWSSVANQANTTTGGAESVVADVSVEVDVGRGMGGAGVVNRFSSIPPTPPVSFGFIEIEGSVAEFILQEGGSAPTRIQLEG